VHKVAATSRADVDHDEKLIYGATDNDVIAGKDGNEARSIFVRMKNGVEEEGKVNLRKKKIPIPTIDTRNQ